MAEQRQRVVTELINTEKDYCSDLELCVKYFLFELQASQVSFCCQQTTLLQVLRVWRWVTAHFASHDNRAWNMSRHIHPSQ